MGFIAKLKRAGNELNLNNGSPFHLREGWIPPTVQLSANLAGGSSANRRQGASLVSSKAKNRNLTVPLTIEAASEAETRLALQGLISMLSHAGDEDSPLYFHFRPNDDVSFEPLWGQYGADYRYEVTFANRPALEDYPFESLQDGLLPSVKLILNVKPYALGQRQRMAFAQGGILEDVIGAVDGVSRGTFLPEATINKMTNPIFGHSTFDNDWTAGANIVKAENTDRKFITHGKSSAKLSAVAATTNTFTQSINVGNTSTYFFSAYVKLPSGGVPTSSDLQLHYGSDQTTTFRSVGDGWYRITVELTGVASATATGVVVKSGRTVYVDGFQIEEEVTISIEHFTSVAHGDLLGCSWDGTAHASTTTRTLTKLSVNKDDAFDVSEGTVRVVVKWETDSTRAWSAFFFFLSGSINAAFSSGSDRIQFSDGSDTVLDDSNTFSAGDIWILHFVFGPNGKKIYLDGVELATTGTYTPNAGTGDLFIGCTGSATQNLWGSLMGFETFAQAMSATEVLDDFNNIDKAVEDNRRLAAIPWFWTRNGDGHIENCNDGTKLNYAVAGGIPGSAPALTRFKIEPDTIWSGASDLWLTLTALDGFIDPDENLWADLSGTSEASACGGAVETYNISSDSGSQDGINSIGRYEVVAGRDIYMLMRLRDDGADLKARLTYSLTGTTISTDYKVLASDAGQRLFVIGPFPFLSYQGLGYEYGDPSMDGAVGAEFDILRVAGGLADVHVDFVMLLPRPFALLQVDNLLTTRYLLLEDRISTSRVSSDDSFERFISVIGDVIEFEPEKINMLASMMGRDTETHEVDDDDFDYLEVSVVPRWDLL